MTAPTGGAMHQSNSVSFCAASSSPMPGLFHLAGQRIRGRSPRNRRAHVLIALVSCAITNRFSGSPEFGRVGKKHRALKWPPGRRRSCSPVAAPPATRGTVIRPEASRQFTEEDVARIGVEQFIEPFGLARACLMPCIDASPGRRSPRSISSRPIGLVGMSVLVGQPTHSISPEGRRMRPEPLHRKKSSTGSSTHSNTGGAPRFRSTISARDQ